MNAARFLIVFALAASGLARSEPTGWALTGNPLVPRVYHTATLLPDGRVLVVGGAGYVPPTTAPGNNTDYLDSAELYDPASGTWGATTPLGEARRGHTATLLADGRVLVAGGELGRNPPDFGRASIAEIYDPATQAWTPTGDLRTPRAFHSATMLDDGRVLVVGGLFIHNVAMAETYDPATGTWSPAGELAIPRSWHTATQRADGSVVVVGGGDNNFPTDSDSLSSVELYDPRTNTWTAGTDALSGVSFATASLLSDGSVLLVGGLLAGNPASILDSATGRWSEVASVAQMRYWHTATTLRDGSVLIAGGRASSFADGIFSYWPAEVAQRFDPASQSWSDAGKHVEPRFGHTATLLRDGRVLVVGGLVDVSAGRSRFVETAELYGPAVASCEKNHYILCRRRLTVPTGP